MIAKKGHMESNRAILAIYKTYNSKKAVRKKHNNIESSRNKSKQFK